MDDKLASLTSEALNRRSEELDSMDIESILRLMNDEDAQVPAAVSKAIPQIGRAVEAIVRSFRSGGRLIYAGAGTSGRLALQDAAECPPTFGTPPEQVQGLMAGGAQAQIRAVEGAEDDASAGADDLAAIGFGAADCLVAVSASGRTPYCIGALKHARSVGAACVAVVCNEGSEMGRLADVPIVVVTGPEVLAGSTRLKAGTAQKLVLNMLSTVSMIRTGGAYRNLMVGMTPTNEKLRLRAGRIVAEAAGVDEERAVEALAATGWRIKTAIVVLLTGMTPEEADRRVVEAGGLVRQAVSAAGEPGARGSGPAPDSASRVEGAVPKLSGRDG